MLATLKANDEENRNRCIHLRDCFDYKGHICIVTDLLGQSVFDFLKGNGFVPFPNSQIQSFARQLFTSIACKLLEPLPQAIANPYSSSRPQPHPHRSQAREYSIIREHLSDLYL